MNGATLRPMPFYLVQPWGRDRYRQATVQSIHDTVDDARLDAITEKLQRDGGPGNIDRVPFVRSRDKWSANGS